jgi:hypothetical protein
MPQIVLGFMAAHAQIVPNNSYAQMLNTTMVASQSLFRAQMSVNQQRDRLRAAAGQSSKRTTSTQQQSQQTQQPQRAAQYPITATDFRPLSPPFMPEQFANAASGVTPEVREQMKTLFTRLLASFESKARKDNLANAFAFISGASLQVRNGKEPSNADINKLIAYFNNTLAASPQYYTLDPRQQQSLYESLIISGGIIAFLDMQGRQTGDANLQTQAKQMSDAVLKSFLGM